MLDTLAFLFGAPSKAACVVDRRVHELEAEDVAECWITEGERPVMSFACTTAAGVGVQHRLVVVGSEATAELSGDRLSVTRECGDGRSGAKVAETVPGTGADGLLAAQFEAMIDAVTLGTEPLCPGEDALSSLAAALACYASVRGSGRWVEIPGP